MLNRSFVVPVLLASASLAFAQDSSLLPSEDSGTGGGLSGSTPSSILVPSTENQAPVQGTGILGLPTASDQVPAGEQQQTGVPLTRQNGGANVQEEAPSFTLPGGFGLAPEKLSAGEGRFSRPPLSFSTTLQLGFDDNVYSASGKQPPPTVIPEQTVDTHAGLFTTHTTIPKQVIENGFTPIKGSLLTQASLGAEVNLFSSRFALAATMSGGSSYYWDRPGQSPYDPSGNFSLIFAYKLTPRMQLSGNAGASYYVQPNLTLANAPVQEGAGAYVTAGSTFHLSYGASARLGLDTAYLINTQTYLKSESSGQSYVDQTISESVRYNLSPRTTAVLEVRGQSVTYNNGLGDSTSQYLLLGLDNYFTRRFSGNLRFGEVIRQYANGTSPPPGPYVESTISYGYGKASTLSWSNRYGFEESITNNQHVVAYRSNLGIAQTFSPKLSVSLNIGYSYQTLTDGSSDLSTTQQTVSAGLSAQYVLSRSVVLFSSFTHSMVETESIFTSYSKNLYFLGASYHF